MRIKKEFIVDAPLEKSWDVLANQYADADKWSSLLSNSTGKGNGINGANCSERICETNVKSFPGFKERITRFDSENKVFAYEPYEGFPGFMDSVTNTWSLFREDDKTKVIMDLEMKTKGFVGTIMGPMLKMQMSGMITKTVEEVKYYIEFDRPHPRKLKTTV